MHTPGLNLHIARKVKSHGEIKILHRSKHSECQPHARLLRSGFLEAAQAIPNECDMNIPPPLVLPFFFSFFLSFFFFIGVSDRVIKDSNLSFPEGQRIGLAISNLIFVQVTAKLKFVLPNKIISPNRCSSRVRVPIRKCS